MSKTHRPSKTKKRLDSEFAALWNYNPKPMPIYYPWMVESLKRLGVIKEDSADSR